MGFVRDVDRMYDCTLYMYTLVLKTTWFKIKHDSTSAG